MHELSVTQAILDIALDYGRKNQAQRVVEIHLTVGEIGDLEDEWLQRYFDFISKGTIAEGAKLSILRTPAQMQCRMCRSVFPLDKATWETQCPSCGSKETSLISGREFRVESLEAV